MKNREEFINSVWEKSEKALACEKRRKSRIRITGSLAAAACVVLVVGIANTDNLMGLAQDILGTVTSDDAAEMEPGAVNDMADDEIYQFSNTSAVPGAEVGKSEDETDNAEGTAAEDKLVADGMLQNSDSLSDEEMYDVIRSEADAAEKSQDAQPEDLMNYYFLPAGIEAEDAEGNIKYASGDDILTYMQWFYSIPENQVLTTQKFNDLEEKPTSYYKFTMDCSLGEDTEGVDRIYYILGDVELP